MNDFQKARFHQVRDLVFNAVLSERVKDYPLQIKYIEKIIRIIQCEQDSNVKNKHGHIHRDLTKLEKNLLNFGLKTELSKKREAWRFIQEEIRAERYRHLKYSKENGLNPTENIARQMTMKNGKVDLNYEMVSPDFRFKLYECEMKLKCCNYQITKIEDEVIDFCDYGLSLVKDVFSVGLAGRSIPAETAIFYEKLQLDMIRYKLEIMQYRYKEAKLIDAENLDDIKQETEALQDQTREAYVKVASECESIEPANKLRLGFMLNYSVFLYECLGKVDDARMVAKRAFDEVLYEFKSFSKFKQEELMPVMQALNDNYEIWSTDVLTDKQREAMRMEQEKQKFERLKTQR